MNLRAICLLSALCVCSFVPASNGAWGSSPSTAASKNNKLTDKLVENIVKKNFDGFAKELASPDMDVNQPDSKGRMPLLEAVKTKDIKFVDGLLQYRALAASVDPATGTNPLMEAFKLGLTEVGRHLLAYGADINTANKAGQKPRDFAPNKGIKELIEKFDDGGPAAFEDEPGTWFYTNNENGIPYWYNRHTTEARWNMPPSCAWQKVEVQHQPTRYVNYVTGQTMHTLPNALAWRLLNRQGLDVWFNWRSNHTQSDIPGELPASMLEEAKAMKNVRWYNPRINKHSWENPDELLEWKPVYNPEQDATFYFNVRTGESTWDQPPELAWVKVDDNAGPWAHFWWNPKTGEKQWHDPDHKTWERHNSDL
uniref:WW domain-containing protein n=1 Tax=Dunaliella tertiolecta TaxID=3047 RepID=A0A7S3VHR5_DUNTE|mmetsp:Transcript_13365/g.36241  ORF Transcript_13365/g.36241 Transcript_13365/m.36241 type:complete len:367 (+) Transcript_13365:41-1141(+)|eukprot:CAMPEP_0202350680 /NCGR_PEP_ID=MMETSP1126-20121109/7652_1 /ASSEMBLY_ACC=CAM_ASM_000457 /TAXON_ID=3047 /ORGANISM="Dunaliella tertiolecta, Strain CCMP1320" /LENGTH=366 /DNA_ID=CAMNT_0048942693 /DNA_START=29 /DNA_END=1129 /DNA_ORIENTATION=+